jgi:hypothetical protein
VLIAIDNPSITVLARNEDLSVATISAEAGMKEAKMEKAVMAAAGPERKRVKPDVSDDEEERYCGSSPLGDLRGGKAWPLCAAFGGDGSVGKAPWRQQKGLAV